MKTGRLLKFARPGGLVHAYLYREGETFHAALYVVTPSPQPQSEPVLRLSGADERGVEREARAWVDAHYPRER